MSCLSAKQSADSYFLVRQPHQKWTLTLMKKRISPAAEHDDPIWSEEPLPDRQHLCNLQIPCHSIIGHTTRTATPPSQPIQEDILQK